MYNVVKPRMRNHVRVEQFNKLMQDKGPQTIGEIAAAFDITRSAVRKVINQSPDQFKCVRAAKEGKDGTQAQYDVKDSVLPDVRDATYYEPVVVTDTSHAAYVLQNIMHGFCTTG